MARNLPLSMSGSRSAYAGAGACPSAAMSAAAAPPALPPCCASSSSSRNCVSTCGRWLGPFPGAPHCVGAWRPLPRRFSILPSGPPSCLVEGHTWGHALTPTTHRHLAHIRAEARRGPVERGLWQRQEAAAVQLRQRGWWRTLDRRRRRQLPSQVPPRGGGAHVQRLPALHCPPPKSQQLPLTCPRAKSASAAGPSALAAPRTTMSPSSFATEMEEGMPSSRGRPPCPPAPTLRLRPSWTSGRAPQAAPSPVVSSGGMARRLGCARCLCDRVLGRRLGATHWSAGEVAPRTRAPTIMRERNSLRQSRSSHPARCLHDHLGTLQQACIGASMDRLFVLCGWCRARSSVGGGGGVAAAAASPLPMRWPDSSTLLRCLERIAAWEQGM